MKSETEIAKKSIRNLERTNLPELTKANISGMVIEHKLSCERFLEFLAIKGYDLKDTNRTCENIEQKITDLKKAIKVYDDAGIK